MNHHRHTTLAAAVSAAAIAVGALAGCGASGAPTSASSHPAPAATSAAADKAATKATTITIGSYDYTVPASVRPGATVTVVNADTVAHTVTATAGHVFDDMAGASSTTHFTAPDKPGSYKFFCRYHANMHGTLIVK